MSHKMLFGFAMLGLAGCFPDGEIDWTGMEDISNQEAIEAVATRAIPSMEVEVFNKSSDNSDCLNHWDCSNHFQSGTLLEGDSVIVRVRLTDQRFDPEPLIPLTQQKIVVALAGETGHRKVLLTDNDGFAATEISLANQLDSSCCKNTFGSTNIGNLYSINVVFTGDDYYLPQEVVPHIELGPGTYIPKTQISVSGFTIDRTNSVASASVTLTKDSTVCTTSTCKDCSDPSRIGRRVIAASAGNQTATCSAQAPQPYSYNLGTCTFVLPLDSLSSGNYALRIRYDGHAGGTADRCGESSAVYNTSVRVINDTIAPLVVPKGLFWGWDDGASGIPPNINPNENPSAKDMNGIPLSLGGTALLPWKIYFSGIQDPLVHDYVIPSFNDIRATFLDPVINIRTLSGQLVRKTFILGVYAQGQLAGSGNNQSDLCPEGKCTSSISIRNFVGRGGVDCPSMQLPTYDDIWLKWFRATLINVADFWRTNQQYQGIWAGFRVGGGFDGEWVNGIIKEEAFGLQCPSGSQEDQDKVKCDYNAEDNRQNFGGRSINRICAIKGSWSNLISTVISDASEASQRSQNADGKKLAFYIESRPFGKAYQQNPMVGFKHNNFDEEGTELAFGLNSQTGQNFGAYRRLFPDHFGLGESKYDTGVLSGMLSEQQQQQLHLSTEDILQRRVSGAYWLSLSAIANRMDTFDFHSGVWELYRNVPGFDRFMNGHLGKSCGEASSGFVAFREVPPNRKKEVANPELKYGTYGNFDHCLYAPYVESTSYSEGTTSVPVRDSDLPLQAQSQYYVMGNKGVYYHSREVTSRYLYFDIDEELKRRTYHSHWKISVVYLDRGFDQFKIDYISASTGSNASAEIVTKQNTGRFVKKNFFISDLAAINSLPGSTDFALNTMLDTGGQGSEIIHFVEATPVEIGKWTSQFSKDTGGWENQEQFPRTLADVNGDGKADIIGFGGAGVYIALSTGTGFGPMRQWSPNFGTLPAAGGWSSQNTYPRMLADVNGDGKADAVGFGGAGVYVALSTGAGFGPMRLGSPSFGFLPSAGNWTGQDTFPRMLADVNGDGKADIIGFGGAGVYVSLSTGSGFGAIKLWSRSFGASTTAGGWTSQNSYPRMLADANGDGRADIIGFGGSGAYVSLSTGAGFGPMTLWSRSFGANPAAGGWSSQDLYPRLAADVNGDNKADIVGFGHTGVYIAYSLGDSFSPMNAELNEFGASTTAGGYASQNQFPRLLADVSGDGWADIVGINQNGVFVRISN